MHSTLTRYRGNNLIAYLAYVMTCVVQPINNQCIILSKQAWYQFANPESIVGSVDLGRATQTINLT